MKTLSYIWSALVGLLSVVAQVATFYARFGRWDADVPFSDYLLFFTSGLIGGLILIWFLNRQASARRRWVVLSAFLLASPVALIMMIGGGMLGPLGVLIFPQVVWSLAVFLGSLAAKLVSVNA